MAGFSMLPYCNIIFLLKNIILHFYFVASFSVLPDFEICIQFGHFLFKIATKILATVKNLAKTDLNQFKTRPLITGQTTLDKIYVIRSFSSHFNVS